MPDMSLIVGVVVGLIVGLGVMSAYVVFFRGASTPAGFVDEMELLYETASWLVQSAEQIYQDGQNNEKYSWVSALLVDKFPNLDERWIKAAIEAGVLLLKNTQAFSAE